MFETLIRAQILLLKLIVKWLVHGHDLLAINVFLLGTS